MKKIYILIAAIFLLFIGISYQKLPYTFYQQDEWWAVGYFLVEGIGGYMSHFSVLGLIAGGGRPLSIPLQHALYMFSLFNVGQFAVFAIFLHFFNTLLLFLIVKKMTNNTVISFIAGLFFATASIASQAVIWIGTSTVTLPSAFFALLSIYLYTFFLHNEQKKFLYMSLGFALISYFFKESAMFLFILLPVMYILYGKKRISLFKLVRMHVVLIGYACLAIFIRLFELFTVFKQQTTLNVTGNSHSIVRLLFHFIFYPFESLSQMFILPGNLFSFSEYLGNLLYTRLWESSSSLIATETIGAEMISVIFSTLLLILVYIVYLFNKQHRKILLFALLFTFLSFLPYIVLEKGSAYLDSRYFYIGVAGGGILLGVFFNVLRTFFIKRLKISSRLSFLIVFVIFSVFFLQQIIAIRKTVQTQVELANERKNILQSLSVLYPKIPKKTIFFVQGTADYYVENNKLPFQQGMGYTLMVWYYKSGIVPKELLQQTYLWGITEQGYKEVGDKGFGYFWDISKLKEEIRNKKIKKENVIGLFYNSRSKSLKKYNVESAI